MEFPKEDYLEFKGHSKTIPSKAYVVAGKLLNIAFLLTTRINNSYPYSLDFESYIVGDDKKHVPCGFAIQTVCDDARYKANPRLYRDNGEGGVAKVFIKYLEEEYKRILPLLEEDKPLDLTPDEENRFKKARFCWMCHKHLGKDKVRDHCHTTGAFMGAAHTRCNLLRRRRGMKLVVLMHNFKVRL